MYRPNRIMCGVDALSRRYGKLIVAHLCISNILHDRDKRNRPQAYQWDDIISSWKSKMNIEGIEIETCPIFIEYNIFEADIFNPENHLDDIRSASTRSPKISVLITQPMKFIWQSIQITNHSNTYHKSLYYVSCTVCILDTEFPAHEPTTTNNCNPILGRRFGILIEHNKKSIFHAQTVRKYELMHFYSIDIKPVSLRTNAKKWRHYWQPSTISIPLAYAENLTNYLLEKSGISDFLTYATRNITETSHCCFKKKIPTSTIDWSYTYISDPNTNFIINIIKQHSKHMWIQDKLATVKTIYWQHLWEQRIILHDGKLILLKLIFKNVRFISIIIVPNSLRRKIFIHYHAVPTGGHMGEYKTLFCLHVRFFWTGLRKGVKEWVKVCAQCVAHNVWRSRKNDIFHG